jgi:Glycosyltransferase
MGNVSRVTPWKGQIFLINAFINYVKTNPNAYLILVGSPLFDNDRYLNYIKSVINHNNINEKVILAGYRTDLDYIYSAIDHFIYPSLEKDTSPLSLLSALASGLPVSFSNIKSLNELIPLFPNAKLIDPKDIYQISLMMEYYEEGYIREIDGNKNKEFALKNFDIESQSSKIFDTIQLFLK